VRVLDLFCCAGGASAGYVAAGFDVLGVDIKPQRNYPYEFVQHDALTFPLDGFDLIHASPPCQHYSVMSMRHGTNASHPDLIGAIRDRLIASGTPYVIENVASAKPFMVDPIRLCGSMFGLEVNGRQLRRHRYFESSLPLTVDRQCNHIGQAIGVYGHGGQGVDSNHYGYMGNAEECRQVMQMPWATRSECCEAIPPAYTSYIGKQAVRLLS
jgi:DNA (cytosine-5)-methyltransferase 1